MYGTRGQEHLIVLPLSRCVTPTSESLVIHNVRDEAGADLVSPEILATFAGLTESERKARYADIKSLLDDACAGEIEEPEDIKPIRRHPELWELRWDLGGTQLRMYHAEPPTAPGYLIALKFHVKKIVPADDAATRAAQNAEIDVAATRYIVNRPWMWGLR